MYSKNILFSDFNKQGRIINFKHSYHYTLKDYFHMIKFVRFFRGDYDKIMLIEGDVLLIFEHMNFDFKVLNKFTILEAIGFLGKRKCDLSEVKNKITSLIISGVDDIIYPKKLNKLEQLIICYSNTISIPYYRSLRFLSSGGSRILCISEKYKQLIWVNDGCVHNQYITCGFLCNTIRCAKRYEIIKKFQKMYKIKLARKKLIKMYDSNYICGYLAKLRLKKFIYLAY